MLPTINTIYFTSPTFVVPANGVEVDPDLGNHFGVSVDANSITVSGFLVPQYLCETRPFNGFEISDLSGNPEISGFSIDSVTNMAGFTTANILFHSNTIWVNWTGLSFDANTIVKIDLTFDPPLNPSDVAITQAMDGSLSPATNEFVLPVADGTELALSGSIDNIGTIAVAGTDSPTAIGIERKRYLVWRRSNRSVRQC